MLKVSIALACAVLMAGSAAAADIPEGSQLVTRAKDLAVVDGGNKVFTGKVKIQALSDQLPYDCYSNSPYPSIFIDGCTRLECDFYSATQPLSDSDRSAYF